VQVRQQLFHDRLRVEQDIVEGVDMEGAAAFAEVGHLADTASICRNRCSLIGLTKIIHIYAIGLAETTHRYGFNLSKPLLTHRVDQNHTYMRHRVDKDHT